MLLSYAKYYEILIRGMIHALNSYYEVSIKPIHSIYCIYYPIDVPAASFL